MGCHYPQTLIVGIVEMITILVATKNSHKLQEIQSILQGSVRWLSLRDFPEAPEIVEDAPTFQGNAAKKAATIAAFASGKFESVEDTYILADDSGLEVDALNGDPGVLSARFAHLDTNTFGNAPDAANNAKLLRLMRNFDPSERTARFCCVLALASCASSKNQRVTRKMEEPKILFFSGTCEGRILQSPQGSEGFGYDPLFVPEGYEQSFAQLGDSIKNRLSHRAKALHLLNAWLTKPHP